MKYPYMRHFCDLLIEHMERGHSFDSFSASIRYPHDIVAGWLETKETFREAKRIGEKCRLKALEQLLFAKQINLETYQFLKDNEDSEIEDNVHNFDESVLVQAQGRFQK